MRIAGIIETAQAKLVDERLELGFAAKIGPAIAGEHFVEQPDMAGHRQCHAAVGRRGQHQFPARALLLAQKREERLLVRERGRVKGDAPGELLFQERPAAQPPIKNRKKLQWIPPEQPRQRFPEQIGFNERAVQIHAERDLAFARRVRRWRHGF